MKNRSDSASAFEVLIRCDGDADIGLGHIVRCLALADELHGLHGCKVRFLIRRGPVAVQMAEKADYPVERPARDDEKDQQWISRIILERKADALVMDFRAGLAPDAVWQWRRQGVLMVSIDDPEDKRIACDFVFSPPVPQVRRANWDGFTGMLHAGWEWVLLRKQFADPPTLKQNPQPVVLVAMGGSDPAGLTLKAVKALNSLDEEFVTILILGGAFCHDEALGRTLKSSSRKFEIRRNVADMADAMAGADLAVASFCVTAYELATVGVPGIYLCLTEDHAESASAFDAAGMGINLGVFSTVTDDTIAANVRRLIKDGAARNIMSQTCRQLASGHGAANIAGTIISKLEETHERN